MEIAAALLSIVELGLLLATIPYIDPPNRLADVFLTLYGALCLVSILVAVIGITCARSLHLNRWPYFIMVPLAGMSPFLLYMAGAVAVVLLRLLTR